MRLRPGQCLVELAGLARAAEEIGRGNFATPIEAEGQKLRFGKSFDIDVSSSSGMDWLDIKAVFDRIDADSDGFVTKEELKAAFARMREGGGRGPREGGDRGPRRERGLRAPPRHPPPRCNGAAGRAPRGAGHAARHKRRATLRTATPARCRRAARC